MNYYKVIKDGEVIDVNHVFLKWQRKHNILLSCEAVEGQFIQSSDGNNIWRVDWLNRLPADFPGSYESIEAVEITAEEYEELKEKLELGETVEDNTGSEDQPDTGETETPNETPTEEVMSATAMRLRIKELEGTVATLVEQNKVIVEQNNTLADELQAAKIILGVE